MSATLSAIFKAQDDISNVFDSMANSGEKAVTQWQTVGSTASTAFEQSITGADNVAKALDSATSSTDNWTSAIGNYDKLAMEMTYTNEELIAQGYKTAEAIGEESTAISELESRLRESPEAMNDFLNAMTENEDCLKRLQAEYIATSNASGENSDAAVALKTEIEDLTSIINSDREEFNNYRKSLEDVSEGLMDTTDKTAEFGEESDSTGDTAQESFKAIGEVLTAVGITKLLIDAKNAVVDLSNAFSEAESIIIKATGASGEGLNSLNNSMLNTYKNAKVDDMNAVAGAIGEINTRLGLQGDSLDHVTSLFMDYSQITGDEVVGSVQNVTKIMKNWGVEVDDLEDLLDKLSVAGQASGISVNQLSDSVVTNKANLQQLGYNLEESIALLSMFEYEGLNSSSIMMGFRTAVTDFANDGKDASVAMQEVIEQIGSMKDESEATTLAIETFGSRAGSELAFAIRNGKFEIEDWVNTISESDGTLRQTANSATTLEEKWTLASNSLETAFTKSLTPVVENVSSIFATATKGAGDFLNKYPAVTSIITGLGTGIGIIATGVAVLTVATRAQAIAQTLLNTAMSLNPAYLVAAGVVALTTAVVLCATSMSEAEREYNSLSSASREQYNELQTLNAEYDSTVAIYGETSHEAQALKWKIDELSASYESSSKSMEQYIQEVDELVASSNELESSFRDTIDESNKQETSSTALIDKLKELATQADKTATSEAQMEAIITKLNDSYPELGLSVQNVTNDVDAMAEAIKKAAEEQAKQDKYNASFDTYADALTKIDEIKTKIIEAEKEMYAASSEYNSMNALGGTFSELFNTKKSKNLDSTKKALTDLNQELNDQQNIVAECEKYMTDYHVALQEVEVSTVSYEDAISAATSSISEDMETLVASYDDAYNSAKSSIDGTIGLFNEMKTETELGVNDMSNAMASQLEFLNLYNENLRKATEYGISDGLITALSDGTAESAGQINEIINEIERLGTTSEEALGFVENFNSQFEDVQVAKEEFSTNVAEMQTNFSDEMDLIQGRLETAIDDMNMEADAANAAKETMQAYVNEISSWAGKAQSAADKVSRAATNALSTTYSSNTGIYRPSAVSVPGHASGTTNAEDVFIAGEDGPELIVDRAGSMVFPSEETNKILNAINPISVNVPISAEILNEANYKPVSEKKITLDITGSGQIGVNGNYDEETVWTFVQSRLKPAIMGMLKQEIFEEGDRTYAF